MAGQGKQVFIELENNRFKVFADGAPWDEGFDRGALTHAQMLAAGYMLATDRYPTLQKKPFSLISPALSDMYVEARQVTGGIRG